MNPAIDFPWEYKHCTVDTQVSARPGVLHTIVVNGLTTAGDVTIYDNTAESGTVIGVIHLNPTTSISVPPITLLYDCKFSVGLYAGFDATLVADLTITYK